MKFNLFHLRTHPHHDNVYTQKVKANFTHEILAAAAGFEAMRLLEDHLASTNSIPHGSNHSLLRELLAGFAAAEAEKLIEEHQLQETYDLEKLKQQASAAALQHYDETYGKTEDGSVAALDNFGIQYCLYAEFHDHGVNQLVHVLFVPVFLWSLFAVISCLSPSFGAWPLDAVGVPLNITVVVALVYSVYYVSLHPVIGGTASLFIVAACLVYGDHFAASDFLGAPLEVALGSLVLSGAALFAGNYFIEKRFPPVAAQYIFEILVVAPLFVWTRSLFSVGLFKELGLEFEVETKKHINTFKSAQEQKVLKKEE
ncbi:hypothetical protein HDU99_002331 [Rhizoclosmatium hyalinum]|nr:hypothetical protein HDU99_002331 [Rhizoclosmatium hyalinum]